MQYTEESRGTGFHKTHSLVDYLRWTLRYFWILLITVIGSFILGQYIYSRTPPKFESHTTVEILRVKQDDAVVNEEEKFRIDRYSEMESASEKLTMLYLYENIASSLLFTNRENVSPKQVTFWVVELRKLSHRFR